MQVENRFGFLAEAFDLVEFAGFGLVRTDAEGGCGGGGGGEEFAEDGLAAKFVEAGEDDGRLGGWCVWVELFGCHGLMLDGDIYIFCWFAEIRYQKL